MNGLDCLKLIVSSFRVEVVVFFGSSAIHKQAQSTLQVGANNVQRKGRKLEVDQL